MNSCFRSRSDFLAALQPRNGEESQRVARLLLSPVELWNEEDRRVMHVLMQSALWSMVDYHLQAAELLADVLECKRKEDSCALRAMDTIVEREINMWCRTLEGADSIAA